MNVCELSDQGLLNNTKQLAAKERVTILQLVEHLVEVERRKLYAEAGYSSMFKFVTADLGYSEPAACRRITAARCARDFPRSYELLKDNRLNLSAIATTAGVLTRDNAEEVLNAVAGKNRREVEGVVAQYRTRPVVRDRIRPVVVPERKVDAGKLFDTKASNSLLLRCEGKSEELKEQKVVFQFSASREFEARFQKAQGLLSHKLPRGAQLEDVFSRLLDEYLERHSPEAKAKRRGKRKASEDKISLKTSHSRNIPAAVRDEVFLRDKGQCSYVAKDGTRCCSIEYVQIDHILPFSRGGSNGVENLRLLCGTHNRAESRRVLGTRY